MNLITTLFGQAHSTQRALRLRHHLLRVTPMASTSLMARVDEDPPLRWALDAILLRQGRHILGWPAAEVRAMCQEAVQTAREYGFRGSVMARINALTSNSPLSTP